MTVQASRIANLSPEKQALLNKRLSAHGRGEKSAIPKRSESSPCLLSFAQERLWFLAQMEPDSPYYHIAGVVRLDGVLNAVLLEQALNEVVRRHEALRTTFIVTADGAEQQIESAGAIALAIADLSGPAEARQADALNTLTQAEAGRSFDLKQGPLLRASLVKLAEQRHILLMTMHHIISDAWSLGVLIDEVGGFYRAFAKGLPSEQPELALQYADFADWQRKHLQGETYARPLAYWSQRLASAPKLLELPTDKPRPAELSYRGATLHFTLTTELTEDLQQLSLAAETTLFMVLMAAFAILLQRHSGQNDLCIGYPVANRNRKDIENLIGFFVNTQVLRADLSDNPAFMALLQQIKKHTLDAQNHQDVPFERIVEVLKPERALSHAPLFQVMLAYQNASLGELHLPGLSFSATEAEVNAAKFDLLLTVTKAERQLQCGLNYSTDLFDEATAIRMAGRLQNLLAGIAAHPFARISELPLLSEAELKLVVNDWNNTEADYPRDRYIHQLFEEQAEKTPDAVAVVFSDRQWSYAELNADANRLAHHLRGLGVGPDVLVGVCLERSPAMIIGLLGILKAGGAYLPLDPAYPKERVEFMMRDVAPAVVLTQKDLAAQHRFGSAKRLCLDADWAEIGRSTATNPSLTLLPEHLAYCIYTSGSTGLPKAAAVPHQGILNRLQWMQEQYRLNAGDAVLQKTPYSFDVSVWEFFWPLMTGARLVIAKPDEHKDSSALIETIIEQRVTTLHFVPSMLSVFIDAPGAANCTTLKRVICSGEALSADLVARFWQTFRSGTELHNLYGPTEASVDVSYWPCLKACAETAIPIGKPIANIKLYLLDSEFNPVPPGSSGELHIAGIGLGRGYLNRPELSAEKFVPNPFAQDGSRLYKTGDLARYRADGAIDYLGRLDHQVKIRGVRIELGEIESQLAACDGVRDAVVIAREDSPGDKRLVAYVLAQPGCEPTAAELRDRLAVVLADYMLPAAFVMLPEFPLTANGKLNRRALPAPDGAALAARRYEAPQGAVEAAIVRIWQALLGVEQIGRHDHFFELGGHSLMAVTLIERLRRQGLPAGVRTVFSAPTVAAMAAALMSENSDFKPTLTPPNLIPEQCIEITPEMLPLVKLSQTEIDSLVNDVPQGAANIQDIYPLAPLQEGILFHYLLASQGDAYLLRSVIAFTSRDRMEAFLGGLQAVINRHDILRTAVHWSGLPRPVQVVQRQAPLAIEEFTPADGGDALRQLLAHTDPRRRRLNLQQAPLLSVTVAADPLSGECLLALLNHHLVCDHFTLKFMIAEIIEIVKNRASELPAPLPYRDFIARMLADSPAEHEAYFRRRLGDIDEPTAPFGLVGVQGNAEPVSEAVVVLSDHLARRIRAGSRQLGVSAAVLFHVAWAQVLGRCSGRSEVVFGTVLSGRLQGSVGSDRVLGMFINTLPIRISLASASVRQSVADTYEALIELLRHEQASLALAQRCSAVDTAMPLFTTLLNYRHSDAGSDDEAWEGCRVLYAEERTNYPITVSIDDLGQGFSLTVQCINPVSPERIAAYLNTALERLIGALAETPRQALAMLDILPETERRQILADFNDTAKDYPDAYLIHQLFEQQAVKTPAAVAAIVGNQSLTYAELNAGANQLAHYLRARGIGPDVPVGVCMERSLEMIIALLGILKAGGAYVPLDPAYPKDRLDFMKNEINAPLLLAQAHLLDKFTAHAEQVLCLDTQWRDIAMEKQANPDTPLKGENLAYCIYTSGSTGRPKGVAVPHRGILNRLLWMQEQYPLNAEDRVLQKTPFSFDVSVWEFFWPLMTGAVLVFAKPEEHKDSAALIKTIVAHNISTVHFVPSMLQAFIDTHGVESCTSLKRVICSGEALPTALTRRFYEKSAAQLYNLYGPTEASVDVSAWTCERNRADGGLPIGQPIANIALYILDQALNPVPVGTPGELHIGGVGLARGYLKRAALTAEKFIPNPYADLGGRLYKTGDLARYRPDGNIEYLGRLDQQVKIRGFRIELGEIEARLLEKAEIKEAVVVVREDRPGDKRLAAYLISAAEPALDTEILKAHLRETLPDYMLPSVFMYLESMPLSANGKLDRKRLPQPEPGALPAARYIAPRTATEAVLAELWADVLGVETVGAEDNFFTLGGHSLIAITLIERLRLKGLSADVRMLFETTTLAALAAVIDNGGGRFGVFEAPPNLIPDYFEQSLNQAAIEEIRL